MTSLFPPCRALHAHLHALGRWLAPLGLRLLLAACNTEQAPA